MAITEVLWLNNQPYLSKTAGYRRAPHLCRQRPASMATMVSIKRTPLVAVLCLLGACAPLKQQTAEIPVTQGYQAAIDTFDRGDFAAAIETLERLDPCTSLGHQADILCLRQVVANYELGRIEKTITVANRFSQNYPGHAQLDQVLYLRGESYVKINQLSVDAGANGAFSPVVVQSAYQDFSALLAAFPGSRYAANARLQSELLRQQLAAYELTVAERNLTKGRYVAAVNRARYLLETYQGTPAVPGALKVLAKAYDALGLEAPAANTRAILDANF
ncbi:MAG: outer membrane protein assembly factor BamD [Motiliproteus sp.]